MTTRRLPSFISRNKGIVSLIGNPKTGKQYNDNLSIFRALSYFLEGNVSCKKTRSYFRAFAMRKWGHVPNRNVLHECLGIEDVLLIEKLFSVNIFIYSINNQRCSKLHRISSKSFGRNLYLNKYGNHYSIISNFERYAHSYLCKVCKKFFVRKSTLKTHRKKCDGTQTKA